MRKIVCFIMMLVLLSAATAVAGDSFSVKIPSGETYPRIYQILPDGAEKMLDHEVFDAWMPMQEEKPLPQYFYAQGLFGPNQEWGVWMAAADTGRGSFLPLNEQQMCRYLFISPDGKLAALSLGQMEHDIWDLVIYDLNALRTVGTISRADVGGWVDSRRLVVNLYGQDRRPDEGIFRQSVAVCEVSPQKVSRPWTLMQATETESYTVNSNVGNVAFSVLKHSVSSPDEWGGGTKYYETNIPLAWARQAWIVGESLGIRHKGWESANQILEPYMLQDGGKERVLPFEASPVHMTMPTREARYAWFKTGAGRGEGGVCVAIPDGGPGILLNLTRKDQALCSAIWISPDREKLLLALDTEPLPRLAIYDMRAQKVTDVLADADYPAWLDTDRFAFVASDPQKSPPGRPEAGNLWESVALCEIDAHGKAKTRTLFQATEMENYFLMHADWETSELVIWQSFVLDPKDWNNAADRSGKEIREPFESSLRPEETSGAAGAGSFVVQDAPGESPQKKAYWVPADGQQVLVDDVEVLWGKSPAHGETAGQQYFWFVVPERYRTFGPGIFLTEPQTGANMFLPLEEQDLALCAEIRISPDGDELALVMKTSPQPSIAVYDIDKGQVVLTVPNADTPVWMDFSRFAYMSLDPAKSRGNNAWSSVAFCERLGETEIKQEILYQATETTDYLLLDECAEGNLCILKITVESPEDWADSDKLKMEDIREPYPAAG